MAVTAGTGGSGTVDTTVTTIFDVTGATNVTGDGATSFRVAADANNGATNVLVVVTRMHDSGFGDVLAAGEEGVYRLDEQGIRKVTVAASTGTATVRWGIRARTGAGF